MRGRFDVVVGSRATPGYLWSLLLDARSWPTWGTVDELVLSRSSDISPDGRDHVGAVRAFRTGRVTTAERIIELEDEHRFVYQDAQNPVMHDYRAEVSLTPRPEGGTTIRWSGAYRTSPVIGIVLRPFLRHTMRRMARGLAAAGDDSVTAAS